MFSGKNEVEFAYEDLRRLVRIQAELAICNRDFDYRRDALLRELASLVNAHPPKVTYLPKESEQELTVVTITGGCSSGSDLLIECLEGECQSTYRFQARTGTSFGEREQNLTRLLFEATPWLRNPKRTNVDVSENVHDLPPYLYRVCVGLLGNQSRARIAAELGLSIHTIHGYVRELYARLAVSGRTEFRRLAASGKICVREQKAERCERND